MSTERPPSPAPLAPFTLRQLAYLVAAADAGTIVRAAMAMHVSPSTMSDAISDLERLLDTRLCVRRKAQGLTLTSAGARAVAEGRALLRAAHELDVALRSTPGELSGPLAIGCFSMLAPTILPPLLSAFADTHPKLDIEVIEASQDRLVELIDAGSIDVAFAYDVQLPRRLRRTKLFELPPFIVLPIDHRLAGEPVVHLADLADEDFIMLDSAPSSTHTLATFEEAGVTPRIRHRTSNPDVVRSLVGRGLGYGMLIQRHLDYSAKGFPLVTKEISPAVTPLHIDIVWSSDPAPTARTEAVIDFARTVRWPQAADLPES